MDTNNFILGLWSDKSDNRYDNYIILCGEK